MDAQLVYNAWMHGLDSNVHGCLAFTGVLDDQRVVGWKPNALHT